MSQPPQPPQPPNTPPDQPYGYPQQSYGYPDPNNPYGQPLPPQEPQQPYGYPQQPYGYPEQNPYAQPQQPYAQPQQPYGYPQQPPQQPSYEQPAYPPQQPAYDQQAYAPQPDPVQSYAEQPTHPQQPPVPAPPQPYRPAPAGGAKLSGGKLGMMIGGIVALVVVIGVGIWLVTSGSGGSSDQAGGPGGGTHSATTGRLLWTVKAPKVSKAQIVSPTPGMWFSGHDVVKQSTTEVSAYDLTSGRLAWTVKVPAGHACDATSESAGGKVAVQYGTHCENVMAIDLAKGKSLWHKPLSNGSGGSADTFTYSDADMAVSANTVAVSWDDNAAAYNLTTGTQQWHTNPGDSCQDQGFAGGSRMIEVYKCGFADNAPYHVRVIDPATGKAQWTWDAPADTQVTNVISVDPVVVGLAAGNDLVTDIWDIDGGRLQGKIGLGRGSDDLGKYGIHCPPTQLTPCTDAVVSGTTLYMATQAHTGSGDGAETNEIAAFDLTTGKPEWLSKDSGEPLDVLTVQGDSIVAYQESGYDSPGKIVDVSKAKGTLSTYTNFSAATQSQEHTAYGPGVSGLVEGWYDGTLVFSLSEVDTSGEYSVLMAALH